ncbi:MAG: hypothetical protein V4684_10410 [Pseudomonadota bacterium]
MLLIFTAATNRVAFSDVAEVADDAAEVDRCDGEREDEVAYSISWYGLEDLAGVTSASRMCRVRINEGRARANFVPMIHRSFEYRAVWTLRGLGWTLAEIGALLAVDKSTVMRRLAELPQLDTHRAEASEDIVQRIVERLQIPADRIPKRHCSASTGATRIPSTADGPAEVW